MRTLALLGVLAFSFMLPAAAWAQPEALDPMTEAVMFQDASKVAALLATGGDPNAVYNQRSALGWAAQSGSLEIVTLLVEAGASLDFVDGVGHTPLLRAVDTRQLEIATYLIGRGADVNAADADGDTVLLKAVEDGYVEVVPLLLAAKADPNRANSDGRTPIMSAVQYRQTELIPQLAAAGADVNAPTVLGAPLLMALSDGDESLIRAVLDAGADPNVKTSFGTPALNVAIESSLPEEVISLLLERKADVGARDSYEQTPLHAAARAGNLAAVTALIGAGADVNATLGNGEKPLTTSRFSAAPDEVVAALLAAGATE